MQPPKRNRFLLWLVLIVVLLLFLAAVSPDFRQGFEQGLKPMVDAWNNVHQPTADTTPAPEWTTTNTFSAPSTSKTATFTITGNDWQLNWTCTPASFPTGQGSVTIDIDSPGQKVPVVPGAVGVFCSTNVYSGAIEEHQSGTFYLAVTSAGQWTVQIEQLI